jgi:hypothetical protein
MDLEKQISAHVAYSQSKTKYSKMSIQPLTRVM